MRIPKIITAEWLVEHGACVFGVSHFRQVFPNGAKLTRRNLTIAANNELQLTSFASIIFGSRNYKKYMDAYRKRRHRLADDEALTHSKMAHMKASAIWSVLSKKSAQSRSAGRQRRINSVHMSGRKELVRR